MCVKGTAHCEYLMGIYYDHIIKKFKTCSWMPLDQKNKNDQVPQHYKMDGYTLKKPKTWIQTSFFSPTNSITL